MPDSKQTYMYKKVNNCNIYLDFYGVKIKKSPVIVFIHGGALIWGSRKDIILEQVQLYNKAGYSVFSLDYRLAPESKLKYIVEDIQDALVWIKKNGEKLFDLDVNKIAFIGNSAGGYLSLLAGTFSEKPNVIISFYGYGDILGEWYGKPSDYYCSMPLVEKKEVENIVKENIRINRIITEGSFENRFNYYLYCRQRGIWTNEISGYDVYDEKEMIVPFCPIHNLTKDYPPTLLIHGDKDTDVPYQQSLEMGKMLSKYEVNNKIIIAQGEGHVFDMDMSKLIVQDIYKEVLEFLGENFSIV